MSLKITAKTRADILKKDSSKISIILSAKLELVILQNRKQAHVDFLHNWSFCLTMTNFQKSFDSTTAISMSQNAAFAKRQTKKATEVSLVFITVRCYNTTCVLYSAKPIAETIIDTR